MTGLQIVGVLMIAALFVGMFLFMWWDMGFIAAVKVFVCTAMLVLWLIIAASLAEGSLTVTINGT